MVSYGSAVVCVLHACTYAYALRNPETASWTLGRALREISEHVLLLSATPIHLKNQDLFQLLRLADEDTFYDLDAFEELVRANLPLVRAREEVLAGHATKHCWTNDLTFKQTSQKLSRIPGSRSQVAQQKKSIDCRLLLYLHVCYVLTL